MGIIQPIYRTILRKNSTFWPLIVVSAFLAERGVDVTSTIIFDSYNKGKQYKDILAASASE